MARINLKGLHHTTAQLAGGARVTYWYAWKGGPRLTGQPGSPEFIAAYNAAVAGRSAEMCSPQTLGWLLDKFQDSPEFTGTSPATQADYKRHLGGIRAEFARMTTQQLTAHGTRALFLEWRDEIAGTRGTRTADYVFAVLARALSWAANREMISRNPCERAGRLHTGNRRDIIWTLEEESAFLAVASPPMRLAMLMALWTGQREGDIIRMTWRAYDGRSVTVRQSKTGAALRIPVAPVLKAALDAARAETIARKSPSLTIITSERGGRGYTSDGFRASFRSASEASGVTGRTFHDMRGTFSTRAGEAGATGVEIAAVTGHSGAIEGRQSSLQTNYLSMTYSMAESCITKLTRWHELATNFQNDVQNGADRTG